MILLAAVVVWLLSGCSLNPVAAQQGYLPAVEGVVMGLGAFALMAVMWWAALRIKRWDEEAALRWFATEADGGEDTPTPCADPLALPYIGMKQEDLLRILASMIVECCMAEELVRKSMTKPETDGRLREAVKCLHGLKTCLGQLAECAARTSEPAKAGTPIPGTDGLKPELRTPEPAEAGTTILRSAMSENQGGTVS
jgi:hypothetical protein